MSHTDHHGSRPARVKSRETNPRWRVAMNARAAIAEQLTDESPVTAIVERPKPVKRTRARDLVGEGAWKQPTIQHATPSRTFRASAGYIPTVGRRNAVGIADAPTPSLMQMAKAREQALREEAAMARARARRVVAAQPVSIVLWREIALSDCEHGCKWYGDADNVQLVHNRTYGCRKIDGPIMPRWEADLLGLLPEGASR